MQMVEQQPRARGSQKLWLCVAPSYIASGRDALVSKDGMGSVRIGKHFVVPVVDVGKPTQFGFSWASSIAFFASENASVDVVPLDIFSAAQTLLGRSSRRHRISRSALSAGSDSGEYLR